MVRILYYLWSVSCKNTIKLSIVVRFYCLFSTFFSVLCLVISNSLTKNRTRTTQTRTSITSAIFCVVLQETDQKQQIWGVLDRTCIFDFRNLFPFLDKNGPFFVKVEIVVRFLFYVILLSFYLLIFSDHKRMIIFTY